MASLARYTRKIFVGDLHGCFDELMALLSRLQHDPSRDELYFVGDLCVKGPDSEKCVDFVRRTNNTYSVMGNHDYETLRSARALRLPGWDTKVPTYNFSTYNARDPLSQTLHVQCAQSLSDSNRDYLCSMPLSLSPHKLIRVVHAGIVPNCPDNRQIPWDLMNIRNVVVIEHPTPKHPDLVVNGKLAAPRSEMEGTGYHDLGVPWVTKYEEAPHIFFGHDAKRNLQIAPFATGLDTGCCYGGQLTAAVVKFDSENTDLVSEENEAKYKTEDWETESSLHKSEAGFVYRLVQQKASKVYLKPTNTAV